ncbi:TRAPP subunit trs31 [Curvularia kusanoi]|uniref:TRAPP subunit trs31 n=1 Tax=Curvularia kusanoi TaxID=90978 RepID=A0A9P4W3N2_CURKU|nr:TRAPP subunit trs31 [Curvularia kusanoi]
MATDPPGPLGGLPSSLAGMLSKRARPDVKMMEEYLDYVIAHEDSTTQEEMQGLGGINQLTAFQVRGFRRDLMMYRKQPKESNRILRILRRLKSKHITENVLYDTAIEGALYLLYHHDNVQVRDAAMSLTNQWMTQYPGSERVARFIKDGADKEQAEEDYESNIGLIKDMEMVAMALQTSYEESSGEGEITGSPNPEGHTAAVQHEESDTTSANSAHVSKLCCDTPETCHGDGREPAVKSLIKVLGTICTNTSAIVEDGTISPQPGPDSTPYALFPRIRPDFTYRSSEVQSNSFEPIRSAVDLVSATRYYIGLDDRTLELLRPALERTYEITAKRFDFAGTTGASMQTLRACSAVTQQHLDKKNAALSELYEQATICEQTGEQEAISAAHESLMKDKAKLERDLQKQGAELERVTRLHQQLKTDIFISVMFPLNQIMNAIGGTNTETRSLFGTGAKAGVTTIKDFESGIKSLSNDLIATKKQLAKLKSEHSTVTAQYIQSQQAHAELKKTLASERSKMNNKYYKDTEARVESLMQQSKAELAEAKAKSRQYEAVMTDRNRLQDELQKVTSENERQRVAKIKFDLRFKDLKEKEQATQQGYEQMCQQKAEADLRAAILEADNLALQAKIRELSLSRSYFQAVQSDLTFAVKMSYGLASLFGKAEVEIAPSQEVLLAANMLAVTTPQDDCEHGGVALPASETIGSSDGDTSLLFGIQINTCAEDTIKSLQEDLDRAQREVSHYKKAYEGLERRTCKTAMSNIDLPAELTRRMRKLESEFQRQQIENKQLRGSLKVAESEVATLQHEVASQKDKIKGAGRKVRNAKEVAGKSDEIAKHAVHNKQLRVSSERKMKDERNEALAKVASLTKRCDELQSDLLEETSGRPHLRKINDSSDEAVAVIPIEVTVLRSHFIRLFADFESYQLSITEEMQRWYDGWKKGKDGIHQSVFAYLSSDKSDKARLHYEKLYGDMVGLVDGHEQTGAEHDGPRSKHSLETTCRKAEERHNSQD